MLKARQELDLLCNLNEPVVQLCRLSNSKCDGKSQQCSTTLEASQIVPESSSKVVTPVSHMALAKRLQIEREIEKRQNSVRNSLNSLNSLKSQKQQTKRRLPPKEKKIRSKQSTKGTQSAKCTPRRHMWSAAQGAVSTSYAQGTYPTPSPEAVMMTAFASLVSRDNLSPVGTSVLPPVCSTALPSPWTLAQQHQMFLLALRNMHKHQACLPYRPLSVMYSTEKIEILHPAAGPNTKSACTSTVDRAIYCMPCPKALMLCGVGGIRWLPDSSSVVECHSVNTMMYQTLEYSCVSALVGKGTTAMFPDSHRCLMTPRIQQYLVKSHNHIGNQTSNKSGE